MKLKKIEIRHTTENVYIYFDEESKDGIIIDPGDYGNRVIEFIKEKQLNIKGIFLTHGHYDHILAVKEVKEFTKAKIYAHKEEMFVLENPDINLSGVRGDKGVSSVQITPSVLLEDKEVIEFKGFKIKTIFTPGHTKGCACYLDEKNKILFTGDTLFKGNVGRSDLPTSNEGDLKRSIIKLFKLDDNIKVYPGHMFSTTIGYEKQNNLNALALVK